MSPRAAVRTDRPRVARLVAAGFLFAALAACGASDGPLTAPASPEAQPTPAATDIDPALLQPLTALGPCTAEPNVIDEEPAEGALLPDEAVLTSQERNGPLTTIKGYVPMTPVQFRVFYQRQDQLEILQIEDEIRESEALLAGDRHRMFVKAQAICELGSIFLAVVAPEAEGDRVPAPAGAGG